MHACTTQIKVAIKNRIKNNSKILKIDVCVKYAPNHFHNQHVQTIVIYGKPPVSQRVIAIKRSKLCPIHL